MIYDRIENLPVWAERCPALRAALLAAAERIAAPFAEGKAELDGAALYAASSVYETKPRETKQFENHHRYLDIQMLSAGEEQIDVLLPAEPLSADYNEASDVEFCSPDAAFSTITLRPGEFLLLLPGEWHRPGVQPDTGRTSCRKIVLKAKLEK